MTISRRIFLKSSLGAAIAGTSLKAAPALGRDPEEIPEAPVARVRHLGAQFLDNRVGVTGADGATSMKLSDDKYLWMFGDTVEGPFESIHGLDLTPLRSNTGALVPAQNAASGIKEFEFLATADGKRPRQLLPFAEEEDPSKHRVWAIHGTTIGDHAYLYYHRITLLDGVDVFVNFRLDGMGIARAPIETLEFERLAAPDGTREFWKGDEPTFGVFVERKEGYLYLWGSLMTGMFLARVPVESIAELPQYEYLVEAPIPREPNRVPRWSRQFEPTAVLFDSVPNEMSASYNAHLGQYLAFHSLGRENKIVMRTAPRITGPWSAPSLVYRPEWRDENDLTYAAKEHPELAREGGRILYVTYVNSSTYIPRLIEITLA